MSNLGRSPVVPDFPLAFGMWTITEALFNALHKPAAAKGCFHSWPVPFAYFFLATIPLIFLFYLAYDIAYTPLLVAYTLEILPYKIRAKGFALMVGLFLSKLPADRSSYRISLSFSL